MNNKISIAGCGLHPNTVHKDSRGYFRRISDSNWLPLQNDFKQISFSHSSKIHTLRGLHFQRSKDTEFKLVTVLSGSIFDVILDLRMESPTYLRHQISILNADVSQSLIIAPGVAHGFMTLEPNSIVHYSTTAIFEENNYSGIRWNDPKISINWPASPTEISTQDLNWPNI
jgi:dTDP-4-dehydrorhamnose 3,5-epimerase